MKAIVTVGVSGSGKSTLAKEKVSEGWVQVERDVIRKTLFKFSQWGGYKFKKQNEERVTSVVEQMLFDASVEKKNVIVSDTNLNPKYRQRLIGQLEKLGYEVEIKPLPITFEKAVKRDLNRNMSVGQEVIYKQYQQWLDFAGEKKYTQSEMLPDAVIFDIDGTLAQMCGRGPFDWAEVWRDKPRKSTFKMLDGYAVNGDEIIFLSGRDGVCHEDTEKWLNKNLYEFVGVADVKAEYGKNLFMRTQGDFRRDSIIKKELFWKHVAPYYDVHTVVDDRPSMYRMWMNELGIENVIMVGDAYKEF